MGGDSLAALRDEIDRIDGALHGLLMERATIIDRLIAAKRSAPTASAFRPDREAAVLSALARRHRGSLPLDAVEGIWRVIMSAFTYSQTPFTVHGDASLGAEAMRDSARFHFGFTAPYRQHRQAAAVIGAVAAAPGDLGMLGVGGADGPWWELLEPAEAPKVVAHLPFLQRRAHPAPMPAMVIARSALEPQADGARAYSIRLRTTPEAGVLASRDVALLASAGTSALISFATGFGGRGAAERLVGLCAGPPVPIGRYPLPFAVSG